MLKLARVAMARGQLALLIACVVLAARAHAELPASLNFQASNVPPSQLRPPSAKAKGTADVGGQTKKASGAASFSLFLRAGPGRQIESPHEANPRTASGALLRPEVSIVVEHHAFKSETRRTTTDLHPPWQVAGTWLRRRPVFDGDPHVEDDGNVFQHLISHLRLRLSRPAKTLLNRVGLERSKSAGRLRLRKGGLIQFLADIASSCQRNTLLALWFGIAESVARAWMELVWSQNRILTLGTRVGRGFLLMLGENQRGQWRQEPKCSCDPDRCCHPWSQRDITEGRSNTTVRTHIGSVFWACKEVALLAWLENVKGVCAVPAPQPLRQNVGRAVLGRAMRLWGQVRAGALAGLSCVSRASMQCRGFSFHPNLTRVITCADAPSGCNETNHARPVASTVAIFISAPFPDNDNSGIADYWSGLGHDWSW